MVLAHPARKPPPHLWPGDGKIVEWGKGIMLFHCMNGDQVDTVNMESFKAGPQTVYLSPCHHHVVVLTLNRWSGVSLHEADAEEVERLASQYNLPELRKALGHP